MKITVLTDNNSLIDRYYLAEPAFCLFIEEAVSLIYIEVIDIIRSISVKAGQSHIPASALDQDTYQHTHGVIRELGLFIDHT